MASQQPLRITIIGAGSMGALHARVIMQSADADIACIVDPDERVGRALAAAYDRPWRHDLDDDALQCDAAVVATPTSTHADITAILLDANVPTLVEKPLAGDLASVRRVVDHARKLDVPLMCGLLERFNPAVRTALRIVELPLHISAVRHSPYTSRIETGVAHDLLIHDVDLVIKLVGRPPSGILSHLGCFHPGSSASGEDVAEALLAFPGDQLASVSASRISHRKVRNLVVSELDRLIEVDMVRNDVTVYRHVHDDPVAEGGLGYRSQTIIDIPAIHGEREPLAAQFAHFVDLVRGRVDHAAERESLLPPHEVVAEIVQCSASGR